MPEKFKSGAKVVTLFYKKCLDSSNDVLKIAGR